MMITDHPRLLESASLATEPTRDSRGEVGYLITVVKASASPGWATR